MERRKNLRQLGGPLGFINLVFSLCIVFIQVVEYSRVSESHCNLKRFEVRSQDCGPGQCLGLSNFLISDCRLGRGPLKPVTLGRCPVVGIICQVC